VIGGKGMSVHKPTALGTLVQAATYGLTIPTIYGTTQSALLAIWAANVRKGKCHGKKGKGKSKGKGKGKKNPPTCIENIDFLIGSNPIEGVLQVWDNADKYALNFLKYDHQLTMNQRVVTIPDARFYHLIAVTVDVLNSGIFNDYGSPYFGMIETATLRDPGSGYAVNDTFTVDGGEVLAVGHVTSVSGGGVVTGISWDSYGKGYSVGSHIPTTATSGTGTGLKVDIAAVGVAYSDTSEYPLWNIAQHGPDLMDAGYAKYYPHVYKWSPSDGPSVLLPFVQNFTANSWGIPNGTGMFHFYYAQLAILVSPLAHVCLTFEPILGDGGEYTPAPSQQILYPEYAGCGSPDIDLGSTGAIPAIKPEIVGAFKRYAPRGDADFADMIEDTMKSGMLQVGSQLGLIQRGVNCNELPGAVQKVQYWQLEPTPATGPDFVYGLQQPVAAGRTMVMFIRWRPSGGSVPTIYDQAGNTWIPVLLNDNVGFWYATAAADIPAGNQVICTFNGAGFAYDVRYYLWEMDQGSTVIDNTNTASGTAGSIGTVVSCSITVTGEPTYIIATINSDSGFPSGASQPMPTHWRNLFPKMENDRSLVCYRVVSKPGTYTFSIPVGSGAWQIGMLALKASQPPPYPKALGDIVDRDTLETVRAQCQAGGLFGSVTMNAQRPASDWLKEFYTCADAAPVWGGFRLKSIPRSEVSAVGNGRVFISPTAAGPAATLTESDLVGDSSAPLISVERKAQVDANNILQVQYFDRNADYNPSVASEPLSGAIALFGPRKEAPVILPEIQDPSVARKVLAIEVRRRTLLRNIYKFKAKANWIGLEAMDLVLINDSKIGITNLPVRLTKVEESDTFDLDMEAEPFTYGCHAPNDLPTTVLSPFSPGSGGDPGSVNAPIIFEAVPRLTQQQNQAQVWLVVSAPSADYGGCVVLISTDGGASYNGIGTIYGSAVTGLTVGSWPAANDPDTANDLSVDLTESLGTLDTLPVADRDNFIDPCYVEGGNSDIPYELMAYDIATLTAAHRYTLPATGGGTNELRRAVFGAPALGAGVTHAGGSRFAFLNPMGVGILKLDMDPSTIGKTIYFKFLAFNTFGNELQDESAATPYSYTPTGKPGQMQNPNTETYTITGGALTQPTATSVHMDQATAQFPSNPANYNARTFTISAPGAPTTYYVTILDPAQLGDTGAATNLSAYCETTTTKRDAPGYIYIGSIVAIPGGGGTTTGIGGSSPGAPGGGQIFINGV